MLYSDFPGTNYKIEADGSLYIKFISGDSQSFQIGKRVLTGFDSSFMPQWGSVTYVATSPNITSTSPFSFNNNTRGFSTNPRYIFSFNTTNSDGNHLGAIKTGGTTWDWQASKSTFFNYHGDYPRNGDFDIGNNDYGNQHSENCQALVNGSNVFWNVNAEFWQSSGVNIWNHFNEDGLLIGNFGVTGPEAAQNGEIAMAGNSFSTALVKVGGDYYIYHCDESRHGGVHSWHVSGLNTIAEQSFPITVSANIVPISDTSSLMAGLPYRSNNFTGGSGWAVTTPIGLAMQTNVYTYDKAVPSISINGNSTQIVKRSLNNAAALNNWVLTGSLSFTGSEPTIGSDNYNY